MLPSQPSFSFSTRAEEEDARHPRWRAEGVVDLLGAEGELIPLEEGAELQGLGEEGEEMISFQANVVHPNLPR